MIFFRRRRKYLITQRQEYCKGFHEDVAFRFQQILSGTIPYSTKMGKGLYEERFADTENDGELPFTVTIPQTNERVHVGSYTIDKNSIGMDAEMTAYQMTREFRTYTPVWELEYIPKHENVEVYGKYMADYRFEYDNKGLFLVRECHSGMVKEYDLPFYLTEKKVSEILKYQPQAKIDFTEGFMWKVVCTGDHKAKMFNFDDYMRYRNLWVALIDRGKVVYKPAMTENMETNKVWFDKRYISQDEVAYIFSRTRGTLQIGTAQNIQNPTRKDASVRRPASYKPYTGQA